MQGADVRLVTQEDKAFRGLIGTVHEHLAMDPCIVAVNLPPATGDTYANPVQVFILWLKTGENRARNEELAKRAVKATFREN